MTECFCFFLLDHVFESSLSVGLVHINHNDLPVFWLSLFFLTSTLYVFFFRKHSVHLRILHQAQLARFFLFLNHFNQIFGYRGMTGFFAHFHYN